MKPLFVADIRDNQPVDSVFLVAAKNHGVTKSGNGYLTLRLLDRSGEIEARVWERAEQVGRAFDKNDFVRVRGQATQYQGKVQIRVQEIARIDEREVATEDFLPRSQADPEEMAEELKTILRGMKDPHLRALAEAFFSDQTFMELFKRAPAGKTIHHSYLGGLLEHTLSLLKLILKVVENYRGIDVDLLLTGGFLHDSGKIYEFSYDRAVAYTDRGQLLGHLIMEIEMVDEKIKSIADFPEELAMLLKHMIVSHHGALEFGSPKLPQTVEAVMLHYLDDLDGKIQSIQSLLRKEPASRWTSFHRAYERPFFRGRQEDDDED
ncbi:MAG: HD domain-containing protein [Deltaproteobacteria bacterium]|nr:HD domain-containing protein [Deltaproteobacteria bacterium]